MAIVLDQQIIQLDKFTNVDTNRMAFKDIMSLIFHAGKLMGERDEGWSKYYNNFIEEFEYQNKIKWPELSISRNDYSKRIDILARKAFIPSDNMFMLILRLLYIENFKITYLYETYNYHPILKHIIVFNIPENSIKKLSIDKLLNLLKSHIAYYMKIYNDSDRLEYQLGKKILNNIS